MKRLDLTGLARRSKNRPEPWRRAKWSGSSLAGGVRACLSALVAWRARVAERRCWRTTRPSSRARPTSGHAGRRADAARRQRRVDRQRGRRDGLHLAALPGRRLRGLHHDLARDRRQLRADRRRRRQHDPRDAVGDRGRRLRATRSPTRPRS